MSVATDSNTEIIFVRLLNEARDVFRPTTAIIVDNGNFKILPTVDYDPNDETWEFLPGSIVSCSWKVLSGCEVRIASSI